LDALAAEGTRFKRAHAVTSWTLPSHASIFTGLYPAAHRVVAYQHRLDDSHTTLAEVLAGEGYQTAAVVSGPFLRSIHNLDQGFELYDQSASNPGGNQAAHGDITNPSVSAILQRFLREWRDPERPFFLFVYVWDVHFDYIPPPPYDTAFLPPDAEPVDLRDYDLRDEVHAALGEDQMAYVVANYDGEIAAADALLGEMFALLQGLDLWEDTAVIVTADHGEEFFEHGSKGHRNNLYQESVHVPLILKYPGGSRGATDERPVSLIDLFPTILGLAGVDEISYNHGRSLLDSPEPARTLFFELKTEWVVSDPASEERGVVSDLWLAVLDGDHKLILARNDGRRELYDLSADPGERRPLGPQQAYRVSDLDRKLGEHLEAMQRDSERWERSPPLELSDEHRERLRSLGYLGER
jgi:arylsulfatase A-like enzyme